MELLIMQLSPERLVFEHPYSVVLSEIIDIIHRPRLETRNVVEAGSASVFSWKGKRRESTEVSVPCRD
jgi:hypothetical protein